MDRDRDMPPDKILPHPVLQFHLPAACKYCGTRRYPIRRPRYLHEHKPHFSLFFHELNCPYFKQYVEPWVEDMPRLLHRRPAPPPAHPPPPAPAPPPPIE